ncbi:uncharacterized protein [Cardiocondyla obscurior]|uniref:uncharacterized protein n=1 Tax=Cardiocondyla obscurior TaxID=286306 RepID=UPI0039656957
MIADVNSLIGSEYLALLKQKIMNILQNYDCAQNDIQEVQNMFNALENPFKNFTSEYMSFKHFSKSTNYIAPVPYEIGKIFCNKRKNNIMQGKYDAVYGQYVPLDSVLKKFFELPNILKDTLAYMSYLSKENSGLQNFIQGRLWFKKRKQYSKEDIVLSLFIYFDDFEVNNPLGSHSGKLGAVYVSLPCLPPECRSLLKNIFLVLLFDSWARSHFKNKKTFFPLIKVLKLLENEGILVQSNLGVKRVYFVLGLLTGDNLGLHQLFGLVESFSASYFCRFCKMHKKDTQKAVKEDPSLLRNLINYNNDIQLDNTSETGIKEECVFHDISSYHITENYTVDELHDGREGLCNVDMLIILRNLTHGKYKCFNLEILNNRMLMFDYGPKDSLNKPPRIYIDHLKKNKLKFTGSEMLCFVRLFGIFVGDLVCEDNPY